MGKGLISALDDAGKTKANIVYVNGAATDNNAALFKSGYEAALKPKIDSGDYTLVGDQSGEWDATKAGNVFEQMYTENNGKIDGAVIGQRHHGRRRDRSPQGRRRRGQDPGHRSGRQRRGSAEHPASASRPARSTRTPTSRPTRPPSSRSR